MLATLQQLKIRIGIELTDTGHDTELTEILTAAGAEFEDYCRREFELKERTEFPYSSGGPYLKLKCWPVVSISSLKVATTYDFDSAREMVADTDYRLTQNGFGGNLFASFGWSNVPDAIRVVYLAGYVAAGDAPQAGQTAVPPDLTEAAIEYASLIWKRKDTIATKSENYDGATTVYQPVGIDKKTAAVLNRYKYHCV